MNDDKLVKLIFIFIISLSFSLIMQLTLHANKKLESQLYETKQELSTQRFYNRILEQQLHQLRDQLREKDTP